MDLKSIYDKLKEKCSIEYKINEVIPFLYPYRELKINALVNKSPEKSLQQIYSVLLRIVKIGYNTEKDLIQFLGLTKDDFIIRELYNLREEGFLDLISDKWLITPQGEKFLQDTTILKSIEKEEFSFLLDVFTNKIISRKNIKTSANSEEYKRLDPKFDFSHKDVKMLEEKSQQLQDVYKEEHLEESYLVDYEKEEILFDKKVFGKFIIVEYKPNNNNENDPFIEVRNNDNDLSLNKELTRSLQEEYPTIVYQLSDSDRNVIAEIQEEEPELIATFQEKVTDNDLVSELSIWETQSKFKEALKTAKKQLLIESPWIKKATLNYLNDIESLLKNKVEVIILYGIKDSDEHHYEVIKKLEKLKEKYFNLFKMIHLPSHFEKIGEKRLVGTHRKLVIKDDDYYIQGSFNFLSFNKKEGEKVANESSNLITDKVKSKWDNVFKEYQLGNLFKK